MPKIKLYKSKKYKKRTYYWWRVPEYKDKRRVYEERGERWRASTRGGEGLTRIQDFTRYEIIDD